MPFTNGIFTRARSWVADKANGLKMQPDLMDQDANDIALGLSNTLLRDGTGMPTADIPWNGKGITGLRAPRNAGDALSLGTTPPSEVTRALGFTPLNPANNLSDLGSIVAAISALGFSASLAASGYAKFPMPGGNFLILQWVGVTLYADTAFSWTIPFPNACVCALVTPSVSNGTNVFTATLDTVGTGGGAVRPRYVAKGGDVGTPSLCSASIFGLGF